MLVGLMITAGELGKRVPAAAVNSAKIANDPG
jgi:hypothetical protein